MDLEQSLYIRALRGERGERVPVWFMRQAGRYLPEYRAVREKHSMLDVIRTPELACEVTLQPLRRYQLDAGIIFADILNPLIGMGLELDFFEGRGPIISNPVRSSASVTRLRVPPVAENVGYTLKAIDLVTRDLTGAGTPLIGFAGAPFTLAFYAIEGGGGAGGHTTKRFMFSETTAWNELLEKLSDMVAEYLIAQVEAGAAALQLFDSWAGILSLDQYLRFVVPHLHRLIAHVKASVTVPLVYFAPQATGLFAAISTIGVDAIGIDWRVRISDAVKSLRPNIPLQGNLDPDLLFAPQELLLGEVERILQEGKLARAHIFNLGHGILPGTPPEAVAAVVERVREWRA